MTEKSQGWQRCLGFQGFCIASENPYPDPVEEIGRASAVEQDEKKKVFMVRTVNWLNFRLMIP